MNEAGLDRLLDAGVIAGLTPAEHDEIEALTETVEVLNAGLVGETALIRRGDRFAALERPRVDEWILRPLSGEEEAHAFLKRRLDEHERMWDGCGCRIDYYR